MKVFNAFLRVLKKHLITAVIYIVVFLVIAIQFTKTNNQQLSFEATKLDIVVFDEDDTDASRRLRDYIGKSHDLKELKNDRDAILDSLYYEQSDAVIVIKKGYADALAAGKTDDLFESYHVHDSYADVFVKNMLNGYTSTTRAFMVAGNSFEAALDKAEEALSAETEVKMLGDENEGSAEFSSSFSTYFQYLAYILISVMISALGPVLIVMEKKEIRQRTLCSGVSPTSRVMQIYLGAALFVSLVWLIFMAAGVFLNGGMFSGRAWYAVLNSFVFTLVAAGIAIFLASFGLKDQALSLLTQIIGLGMSFLCGVFVPQSFLSDGVLAVGRLLPAYWYVRANIVLVGAEATYSSGEVIKCISIEACFAAAMFIGAVIVSKKRKN